MLQTNTTPPLYVDPDDTKWMTLFKRVPNQVTPAASKEEKKSWWNRLLGCEKGADVSCPSSNDSEYKCAAIKKQKSNTFHLWPCCMRCGDVPEKNCLQEPSTSISLPDMVEACEIQPEKKKSRRVSFQEDHLTTSPKDPETDCVPKPVKSIIKKASAEQNGHFNDIIQDDVAPTKKKIQCCWKRCQVAPNPKQSLNSSVGLRGLPENRTSWKMMKKKKYNETIQATPMTATLRLKQYKYLGLPNPAQICYMNASLQSLLTLEDFVEGISCQQPIWSLSPEAALLKSFMNISACHSSSNVEQKINCLYAFKSVVSTLVPEFQDLGQKDSHEFLTSLLDQIRNLKPVQQNLASAIGKTYTCPVEEHFVFTMQNIRMCLRCSKTFTREEEFTNLSLDLLPGCGTVKEMLQNYLKNTQVDFQCECGSNTSLQNSSFITLPRVLVLHLKRFVFFSVFGSIKVRRPVSLSKELFLPSKEDGARYSLVSIINHNGFTTSSGHYISDGVDPAVQDEDQTDRWFTYNDLDVQETSYAAVCNKRQTTAYVLFYRRHE